MCDSWGARPQGSTGKVVWFTLPAPVASLPGALQIHGAATTGPFTDLTDVSWLPGAGPVHGARGGPVALRGGAARFTASG
jgi:hypothetical protein